MALRVRILVESHARVDSQLFGIDLYLDKGPKPMSLKSARRTLAAPAALLMLATLTGCKSDNIFFSVENGSGGTLHDVKVTFPGDKFTIATLSNSTIYGTNRHFDGPGDLTVSYSTEDGRTYSSSGPQVTGKEIGEVDVSIVGKYASFDTKLEESQQ
jgi:hypothetical protein